MPATPLLRPVVLILLAGMMLAAAPLRADGPRQPPPRTPITPANVAQIVDLGVVVDANAPLVQIDWVSEAALIALSRTSTDEAPAAILSGPAAHPLADLYAVTLRGDTALSVNLDRTQIAVLSIDPYWPDEFVMHAYAPDEEFLPQNAEAFAVFKGAPCLLGYSPDGAQIAVVAAVEDMSIVFRLDAQTGELLGRDEIPGRLHDLSYTPDSTQIAVISEEELLLLAIDVNQLRHVWARPMSMALSVTALDDRMITTCGDGSLSAWALTDSEPIWNTEPGEPVTGWAITPAGDVLAVGRSGGGIEFYDPLTGVLLAAVPLAGVDIQALAFNPEGSLLAAAVSAESGGSLHLLGLPDGSATLPSGPAGSGPGAPDGGMLSGSAPPPAGPPTDGTYPLDPPGESE